MSNEETLAYEAKTEELIQAIDDGIKNLSTHVSTASEPVIDGTQIGAIQTSLDFIRTNFQNKRTKVAAVEETTEGTNSENGASV